MVTWTFEEREYRILHFGEKLLRHKDVKKKSKISGKKTVKNNDCFRKIFHGENKFQNRENISQFIFLEMKNFLKMTKSYKNLPIRNTCIDTVVKKTVYNRSIFNYTFFIQGTPL